MQIQLSSEFTRLATETAQIEYEQEEDQTLTEYYEKCMDQAHIDGVPKHEVSKTVLHALDEKLFSIMKKKDPDILPESCKINRTLYHRVSARLDYRDPKQVRNVSDTHVEPKNSSIYTENIRFINGLRSVKSLCNILETSFREIKDENGNLLDLSTIYKKKEIDGFMVELETITGIVQDCANDKTKIPTNTHHIFKEYLRIESGLVNVAKVFLKKRLEMINKTHNFITKKQASKFKVGAEPKQLTMFKPTNRDIAIFQNWLGVKCPHCGSWRVKENQDSGTRFNCLCIDCVSESQAPAITQCRNCHLILYDIVLKEIISCNKHCPNCNVEIDLPPELEQRALEV